MDSMISERCRFQIKISQRHSPNIFCRILQALQKNPASLSKDCTTDILTIYTWHSDDREILGLDPVQHMQSAWCRWLASLAGSI